MGNAAARPHAPAAMSTPILPAPYIPPLVDPVEQAWADLQPEQATEPLDFIRSHAVRKKVAATQGPSLEDAWEIAMAWREPLLNRVRLVIKRQGPQTSSIESVAWIRFQVNLTDDNAMSIARAAAVTWAALARCPGYGGRDNPVFWKCVFSELSSEIGGDDDDHEDTIRSVSDSIGFFDESEVEFPRFQLSGYGPDVDCLCLSGLRLFCGVADELVSPFVQEELAVLLSRLDRFLDTSRVDRLPEVSLRENLAFDDDRGRLGAQLSRLIASVNSAISVDGCGGLGHPQTYRFRLTQWAIAPSNWPLESEVDVDRIASFFRAVHVKIAPFSLNVSGTSVLSPASKARLVRSLCRPDGKGTQATTTTITLSEESVPLIGAIISALPFATSMHSIEYSSDQYSSDKFDDHDLPWLAYAMFHPNSHSSSWRELQLEVLKISEKSVFVVESMARGNNIEALLYGKKPVSNAYYSASIRTATVRLRPRSSANVLAMNITSAVDVCGVTSTDPRTWKRWVSVVVPGYGLGWVRSRDLVGVHVRPPSHSSLMSFTLRQKQAKERSSHHVSAFFTSVGHSLQYLNVAEFGAIESASVIRSILVRCPSLKSFVVGHTGELWSGLVDLEDQSLPRLRELELRLPSGQTTFVKPSLDNLHSSLSNLEALRLVPDSEGCYPRNLDLVEYILHHATSLRYFHWQHYIPSSYGRRPCSYMQMQAWSHQLLNLIEWKDDCHRFLDHKSRVQCVAAVLSVGSSLNDQPLNRDVVGYIFQYIAARTRRQIIVDPKWRWL